MKRKFLTLCLGLAFAAVAFAQQGPKYVFYFIGDGMGVNQVNATETYLAAVEGRRGIKPLTFPSFPNVALVNTQSDSHGITDSAAGGTALATGRKTYNNAIGVLPDSITPITSIAVWAKDAGAAVGIATSVSVDHATPACFYAHQKHRKMYAEIGRDLVKSNFDFFAGSDFLKPAPLTSGEADLYTQARNAGFTIANGKEEFNNTWRKAKRMIYFQSREANHRDSTSLPYALDRKPGDLTLADITRGAIDFLLKKNPSKFFCMIEGGKIDWACHTNDAAPMVHEVVDTDEAVRVAYEFYKKHPKETLILITADHETGGLALGNGGYNLDLRLLASQTMSSYNYTARLKYLRRTKGDAFTWDLVRKDLEVNFGFGTKVQLTRDEIESLRKAYTDLVEGRDKGAESLYASESGLSALAKRILPTWPGPRAATPTATCLSSPSARAQSASAVALTTPKSRKSWPVWPATSCLPDFNARFSPLARGARHTAPAGSEKVPRFPPKAGDFSIASPRFSRKPTPSAAASGGR